jgi:hypothetical protein
MIGYFLRRFIAGVGRDDVILPERTLSPLDRNVGKFVAARSEIKALRCSRRVLLSEVFARRLNSDMLVP